MLRRRFVEALVLLITLGIVCGALGGAYIADHDRNFGVAFGTDYRPISHTDVCPYGANTLLDQEVDEPKIRQTMAMLRDAHFCWIRQEFAWDDIEKSAKGVYWEAKYNHSTWDKYDRIMNLAQEYGLQVIARIDRAPEWARPGKPWKSPPQNYEDFGDFVQTLVERYRGRLHYIQIWNEPNLSDEWGQGSVDAAAYTRLLKIAATRARAVDPNIVILTASLAPNDQTGPTNLNDLTYLQQMYDAGAAPYFDVVGAQAYGLGTSPDDRRVGFQRMNFSRPILTHEVMVRNGDTRKPVWITEYAWISLPDGWAGEPSIWGQSISEDQQAQWLVRGYERARDEWPWMGPMTVWFFREPRARDPRDPTPYFAIVRPDFSPRPAYLALQKLAGEPAVAGVGYHDGEHPAVVPGQGWSPAAGGALSGQSGDELQFRFKGTALSLDLLASPGAKVSASVDGKPFFALTLQATDAGTASRTAVARGLPDSEHQVRLHVTDAGGVGQHVTFRGFVVGRERAHPWLPGLLYGVLAVLLMFIGARLLRSFVLLLDDLYNVVKRLVIWSTPWLRSHAWPLALGTFAVAFAVFYWTDTLWLSAVTALVLLALAYLWPRSLLLGVMLVLSLDYQPKHIGQSAVAPAEALILLTFAGVLLRNVVRFYRRLPGLIRGYWVRSANLGVALRLPLAGVRFTTFDAPAALFFLAATLSLFTLAGGHPHEALREYRTLIIVPLLLYYLLCTGVRDERMLFWIVDALVLSAVVVSAYGFYQYFFTAQGVYTEGVVRIMSVYKHPNNLALFLGRVLPFTVAFALFGPNGKRKALYTLATWPILLALFLTYSRAGWLAAFAMVAVLAVASRRKKVLGGLGILVVIGLLATALLQTERLVSLFHPGEGSDALRIAVWHSSLNMLRDHPIFGIGLDQFLYLYPRYMYPVAASEPYTAHPHNVLLDFWLRLGIIGVIALGWILTLWFRRVKSLLGRVEEPSVRVLLLGMLGSMTAFLVHGLFDNSYFLADLSLIFWLMMAMAELIGRREAGGTKGAKRESA